MKRFFPLCNILTNIKVISYCFTNIKVITQHFTIMPHWLTLVNLLIHINNEHYICYSIYLYLVALVKKKLGSIK